MGKRGPNEALAGLFHQTGMSEAQFARAVNRVGSEAGLTLHYDQPSVSQWLSGTLPRAAVRPVVIEVLARRLRRPVTFAQAGFPAPAGNPNIQAGIHVVEALLDLAWSDMDPSRRGVLNAGMYSATLAVPAWQEVAGRLEAVQSGRTRRIGMAEVAAVTSMTDVLSRRDTEFGGRQTRPMAASFLANTVLPHLRADAPGEVRAAMLSAASDLTYLTGWMAVDDGAHGLGQRYYLRALDLAGAADDHVLYCTILRGMSIQALSLGDRPTALRLANASAAAAPGVAPRKRAFFLGHQAHALAFAGDRRNALRALQETEAAMDQAEARGDTSSSFAPSTVAYATAQVQYELGDVTGSVKSLERHARLEDSHRRRARVKYGALMAERQLQLGHLDAACDTWHHVLDEYPGLASSQADERVVTMRSLLRPHRGNRAARDVLERARALVAA